MNEAHPGVTSATSEPAAARDTGVVVLVRPPILFLVAILAGIGLNLLWPTPVVPQSVEPLGGLLVVVAIVLFASAVREFRRAATPIRTRHPVTLVVRGGPYRFSRNPIYLSFTLLLLGIGIWVNSAWLLGMLVPTVLLIRYGVIAREERYLTTRFGEEYLRYQTAVRRWI